MICPSCGADPLEYFGFDFDHEVEYLPCCEFGRETMRGVLDMELRSRLTGTVGDYYGEAFGLVWHGERWLATWHLQSRPMKQGPANAFITQHHRHVGRLPGWKFGLGCFNGPTLVGVAWVALPASRVLMQRGYFEVRRLCINPELPQPLVQNACTKLYAACRKEARKHDCQRLCTYVRADESGHTLRAAGWEVEYKQTRAKSWNMPGRPRKETERILKVRWGITV